MKDHVHFVKQSKIDYELSRACIYDHVDKARELLKEGAGIESIVLERRTPLLLTTINASENAFKELLPYKPNPNARDKYGWTPLFCAIYNRHRHMVETLLQIGAQVNISAYVDWDEIKEDMTPLAFAIKRNSGIEIVDNLLRYGAIVTEQVMHFAKDDAKILKLVKEYHQIKEDQKELDSIANSATASQDLNTL